VSRNTTPHPGSCRQAPPRWPDRTQQLTTQPLGPSYLRLDRSRRETLAANHTFAMWARAPIDNDLPAKRHLLQPTPRLRSCAPPRPSRQTRVGALPVNELPPNAAAMVTARASGHCEIMAPACLLGQQLIFTRRTQGCPLPPDSPAAALAACHNCAELIEQTDPDTALRYGYITDNRQPTTSWPVYWRQRRWVSLSHFGQLIDHDHQPAGTGHLRRPA
jgi:hypothetical protein